MRPKLKDRKWYPYAVALCIAVALFVFLMRLEAVGAFLKWIGGLFTPIVIGLVLAYLMDPLARLYQNKLLKKLRSEKRQRTVSLALAVVTVLALLVALLLAVVPQLVGSIRGFVGSLDENADSLLALVSKLGISTEAIDLESTLENILTTVTGYIKSNAGTILNTTLTAGKTLGSVAIGFMLSLYLMAEKDTLKRGVKRLLRSLLSEKRYEGLLRFCAHADGILIRYILYSLLECVIVGAANAIFMLVCGMSYTPLVSIVVAVTNLIPTFGPLIGAVIGAFILLLAKPMHALVFLLFTVVLQLIDGYVIKPRLFGNSLSVSGLWILIAIVLGGKLFGVVGMLVAIPCAAICVDLYGNYLMPWLEQRRKAKDKAASGSAGGKNSA